MKLLTRRGYPIEEREMVCIADTDTQTSISPLQSPPWPAFGLVVQYLKTSRADVCTIQLSGWFWPTTDYVNIIVAVSKRPQVDISHISS
jgi:hypothetical protein